MAGTGLGFGTGPFPLVAVESAGSYLAATHANNAMWNNAPSLMDPNISQYAYYWFDDFFSYDDTATVGRYVSVKDAGGTVALADDVAGGQLKLTCAGTTDNDGNQASGVSAPFLLAANKHLWFEARVKMSGDITQSDMQVGLVALGEDLTGVADNYAQDGVVFTKTDGSTTLQLTASKDGTNTGQNTSVATLALDTWYRLGFYVHGLTRITPYVDGVAKTPITATFCDNESLAPFFGVRNGDGTTTEILTVDYVKVIQLR